VTETRQGIIGDKERDASGGKKIDRGNKRIMIDPDRLKPKRTKNAQVQDRLSGPDDALEREAIRKVIYLRATQSESKQNSVSENGGND